MRMHVYSVMSDSLHAMDYSPPGSSGYGISRQEYRSGLPFPPPGALFNPKIEPVSLENPALAGGFFTTVPAGRPKGIFLLPEHP